LQKLKTVIEKIYDGNVERATKLKELGEGVRCINGSISVPVRFGKTKLGWFRLSQVMLC